MGSYGKDAQRHHLDYIQRDSAAREGDKGSLFGRDEVFANADEFHERGKDDRHQFRVIISPEDGKEIGDLRSYTRNVMAQMERDLETRLDWVAANHYDTANPHTHVVIRGVKDNGKTLVIPREYISHGMREAAEHIATLELGPITQIDVAKKLAGEIHKERFTKLDRDLLDKSVNRIVDLTANIAEGMNWQTRFEKGRVKALSKLGLAEKVGFGKWRLDDTLERTLRRLGDRGDIIKAYHRVLKQTSLERASYNDPVYDPGANLAKPVTGRVVSKGVLDDVNDRTYIVIDTVHGEAIFVETGRADNIADIDAGMIVRAGPQSYTPKQSDYTIADIASKRGGVYSPSAHEMSDPSAREEFIKAHVRRLEALRRKGHAERNSDGSWTIPRDYLKRASQYEKARGFGNPVRLDILSRYELKVLPQTIGKTWLDEELRTGAANGVYEGFGEEVETAKIQRQKFLMQKGLISEKEGVSDGTLKALETLDLEAAGKRLSGELGKDYVAAPDKGRISGKYREAIIRPSGKYAVIEKSQEFTLVPWRETMDRNLGKSISGSLKGQTISWTLNKIRGQSIT
jgi:type IV secretory pathway VirD2 relaxase